MIMSDVAAIVFTVLAALVAMPCIALVYGVFFPGFARRAEVRVTRNPVATFLAGILATGLVFGLAVALGQGPAPAKFAAVVLALGGGGVALSGMAGIAGRIGHATASPVDADRPWRAVVRGSVILELACVFPVVGWLLMFPAALLAGMGAAGLALIPEGRPQHVPQAAPAPPPLAFVPQAAFATAGPEEVMHRA